MPSKLWIKLYHEILDDPKMGRLSDRLFRRCIQLFLLAGECNQDGLLPPLGDMAWRFHITDEELEADLHELVKINVTQLTDNGWLVVHFASRQKHISGAERTRQWRRRKDNEPETEDSQQCDEPVTQRHVDRDRDRDIDTDNTLPKGNGAAAPPPPAKPEKKPKTPKEKKTADPPPPAVEAYKSVARTYPNKALWPMIDNDVGNTPAALDFWRQVVTNYIACGWNKANIKSMLEFYGRREIPAVKGKPRKGENLNGHNGTERKPTTEDVQEQLRQLGSKRLART